MKKLIFSDYVLTTEQSCDIIIQIFYERTTAMAVYNLNRVMNTVEVRGMEPWTWELSGLYCRTQISI